MPISKFVAASDAFAAAASTAPFFAIQGSATKTVRVRRVVVSGPTLTAVAYLNILVRKTSTAVSSGTPAALTAVNVDAGSTASTANLINTYTAAPTAGTAVGIVASRRVLGQATTAAAGGYPETTIEFDFRHLGGIVLSGTAQGLSVSFGSAPGSAVTLSVSVEFEEE